MGPVLITGAAGRIGSVVSAGLHAAGFDLVLTDRERPATVPEGVSVVIADITDRDAMMHCCAGIATVIHLAGHPNSRDWSVVETVNATGSRIVFEAAARQGVRRILYASSIHVAGFHAANTLLTADLPLWPDSPYGVSKVAAEAALQYVCEQFGVRGFALRLCSVRPAPSNARELATWLSHGDMVRLALACLSTSELGFHTVWGVSNNTRARVDRNTWARIGYEPHDNAEDFVAGLERDGIATAPVSEWPRLGGAFARAGDLTA